ncbi:hypothetical protein HDU96_000510 [Phlyctochytrium bullatum]|nr:hypothetical protein HDU96_000510 [Phlyctochytrium bullatum]
MRVANSAVSDLQYQLDDGPFTAPALIFSADPDHGFDPKAMRAEGKRSICYINVASLEIKGGRPDEKDFPREALGKKYPGWPERFLDTRHPKVRELMRARFQRAKDAGCEALDPDNTEVFLGKTGFPLTLEDGVEYIEWIANETRALDMSIGLKNGFWLLDQLLGDRAEETLDLNSDGGDDRMQLARRVLRSADFVISEGCYQQKKCGILVAQFIARGLPVFNVEYTDSGKGGGCSENIGTGQAAIDKACGALNALNIDGFIKACELDGGYQPCQNYVNGVRS